MFSSNWSYICGAVFTIIPPSIDIQLQKNAKMEKLKIVLYKIGYVLQLYACLSEWYFVLTQICIHFFVLILNTTAK